MKRFMLIYIMVMVAILAVYLLTAGLYDVSSQQAVDTVAVNEITKLSALNWDEPARLDLVDFAYRFFLVDDAGATLYSSGDGLPGNAQTAIRLGFLPMSIESDGRIAGTALIETRPWGDTERTFTRLRVVTVVTFLALCVLNGVFLSVLYRNVVRPFRLVERFAHKVSAGVLDEPLPADERNPFGLFAHSFDIMRDSLTEARQERYKAERAQKELIASLSHDIKTPLTSIRLVTELLQVGAEDSALLDKLATIESKANLIDRLMNDMLLSALEELGELSVNPVSESSGVLPGLFIGADHASRLKSGSVPPCMVDLDPARMEQVIGNIVVNSYKYAGTAINVSYRIVGEGLQIDIDDYGAGVEQEALELLTAKFYRGQNAIASQQEGEGLGLYIAKQLMEKMGGALEAMNRDDGFTIRLWLRLSR